MVPLRVFKKREPIGLLLPAVPQWIILTRGLVVETLEKHGARVISIGPETTKSLKKLGVEPAVEAQPHTIDGMVEALVSAVG